MLQNKLHKKAETLLDEFESIIKQSSPFEAKGVIHSEMLFAFSIAKELGVQVILESGRARGQSTELTAIFSKYHDIDFHSIEYDKFSPDVEIAERRLKNLKNFCTLHYGDSFDLLPKIIDDRPTLIIIDGPKGIYGLKLGLEMMKFKSVKGILFHDTHRDANDVRPFLEKYFRENMATSDDYNFVNKYKYLDQDCWLIYSNEHSYQPYLRKGKLMRSYSNTFSFILNIENHHEMLNLCIHEVQKIINKKSSKFYKILNKIRLIKLINWIYKKLYL